MKTVEEFKDSLKENNPPDKISELLQALWWEAKGNWDQAHKIAQDDGSAEAAWVHAYLHRKEGEDWNASYWYSRAGKSKSHASFDEEWEQIVTSLLQ